MSLPKTSWPGIFSFVWWYVERTVKAAAARIPIKGSASSTYVPVDCTYVHGSLILDVVSLWLRSPVGSQGKQV